MSLHRGITRSQVRVEGSQVEVENQLELATMAEVVEL